MNRSSKKCAPEIGSLLAAGLVLALAAAGLAVAAEASPSGSFAGELAGGQQQADLQQRARTAQRQHERARRRAAAAGADSFATGLVTEADGYAAEGEAALERGDFAQAATSFGRASDTAEAAIALTARAAEAARREAEAASRAVVHDVAAAEAEIEKALNLERRGRFNDARLAYAAATSLYESATGTERTMVDADVFAVLRQYEDAMEAEDLEAFKNLWVEIDEVQEHRVRQSFEWFDSIQIDYSETTLVELSADTAIVTSVQRTEWVAAESGESIATDTRVTFNLRKQNAAWRIERLRMEAVQR